MQPIKVQYRSNNQTVWGWWIDTVSHASEQAVIIPIGGQGNPSPITVQLDRVQVINGQNPSLPLEEPYARRP